MNYLSNAFSVLNLDVEDDKELMITSSAAAAAKKREDGVATKSDKGKKKDKGPAKITLLRNDINEKHSLSTSLEECKPPLVLLDLEKTDKGKKKDKGPAKITLLRNDIIEKHSLSTSSGECKPALVLLDLEKTEKGKKKDIESAKITLPRNDVNEKRNLSTSSGACKLPLVWIDLEMTGLDVEVDRILEIACIITDGNLKKLVEGPDLVIHQTKECLGNMGEWCQNHHAASGLTERVLQSTTSERDAEKKVMEFVKKHIGTYTPLLAGNSVYVDFSFLKKYMPDLAGLFSHVLVDVSSIKALCIRWYPSETRKAPSKENKHRAMDDIKESINELRYYKEHIFKASKSGR